MNTLSYRNPNTRWNRRFWLYATLIFTEGLLLRLYLGTQFKGYVGDQSLFVDWMNAVHQYGVREFVILLWVVYAMTREVLNGRKKRS